MPHSTSGSNSTPTCIIIVDDDTDDLFFLAHALKAAGVLCQIYTFENGKKALQHLSEKHAGHPRPAVIIADLNMPLMNGKELLKAVKKDPEINEIPFIIFSTSSAKSDIDECYELGADSYLVKPHSIEDLEIIANGIKAIWID